MADGRRSRAGPVRPGAAAPADARPAPNFPEAPVVSLAGGKRSSDTQAIARQSAPGRLDEAQLGSLVEQARAGDLAAFEAIVRALQGPVRAFTRRFLRDPHLGDDAAQETLLRIWKGLRRHEPRGRFIAWSFTVARNTCIEFLRREARTPVPTEAAEDVHAGGPSSQHVDEWDMHELRRVINDAIAQLDEPFRTTFLLRETGLAYDEVAEVLRCPVGTVRSRLHVARRRLTELLRPVLGGDR